MTAIALGNVAKGLELLGSFQLDNVWVRGWIRVIVVQNAERILLEVVPAEGNGSIVHKRFSSDPVFEFMRVTEMRTPRNVPLYKKMRLEE